MRANITIVLQITKYLVLNRVKEDYGETIGSILTNNCHSHLAKKKLIFLSVHLATHHDKAKGTIGQDSV